jgi:hypothetical protein
MGNYATGALILSLLIFFGMRRQMLSAKTCFGQARDNPSKTNFHYESQVARPTGGKWISSLSPSVSYQF